MKRESTFGYVADCIDNEGMYYCFEAYSDFEEVEDEEFHKLRTNYLNSVRALKRYIKRKVVEEQLEAI